MRIGQIDEAELARLRAQAGPVDAVRTELVLALRAAIASGDYCRDPVDVARSMLRELLGELLS